MYGFQRALFAVYIYFMIEIPKQQLKLQRVLQFQQFSCNCLIMGIHLKVHACALVSRGFIF